MPASCLKIVTTAAALRILGKETRFETKLEVDGDVKNGILQGNLVICGGGDPCLGSDRVFMKRQADFHLRQWKIDSRPLYAVSSLAHPEQKQSPAALCEEEIIPTLEQKK